MNTDALEFVDTSRVPIEAGDLVMVIDDRAKVIKLQAGHGEWVDDMGPVSTNVTYILLALCHYITWCCIVS